MVPPIARLGFDDASTVHPGTVVETGGPGGEVDRHQHVANLGAAVLLGAVLLGAVLLAAVCDRANPGQYLIVGLHDLVVAQPKRIGS
jgi:hypothetical protein